MKKHITSLLFVAFVLSSLGRTSAKETDPEVAPFAGLSEWKQDHEQRIKWFREARFGMFIHFGLYSAAGGYWPPNPKTGKKYTQHYSEWIKVWASAKEPEYGTLLKAEFAPEKGCTDEWAKLAKEAGMRYAVLTTKHHEGYTLFNSKAPHSVKNPITGTTNISPAGRDLVGEFAESFRKQDLKPGVYYSLIDWQFPDRSQYKSYMMQHLTELSANYGPLCSLWVDFSSAGSQGSYWGTRAILEAWRKKQPNVLINNRFWNGLENDYGDFFTPEKSVPPTGHPGRDFEVNHTMNESYGFSYHDNHWKSTKDVLFLLSDIVSKGGNLLLNVGPDSHGHIPEQSTKTLREVGQWLKTNGDAIYGTSSTPFTSKPFNGRCTVAKRGEAWVLYCHLHEWPKNGLLSLAGLMTPIKSAALLGKSPVELAAPGKGPVEIKLPATNPEPGNLLPIVAVTLNSKPEVDPLPYVNQAGDRSVNLLASQALLIAGMGSNPNQALRLDGDHIGWWSNLTDSAWFPFMVTQATSVRHTGGTAEKIPGEYDVMLEYSVPAGSGGEVEIRLLDQVIRHTIKETGTWNSYQFVTAGKVTLSQTGLLTMHVRPLKMQGQGLMNLRSIRLVPKN